MQYGEERDLRGSVVNPICDENKTENNVNIHKVVTLGPGYLRHVPYINTWSYLVINYNVYGAVRGVVLQIAQVERFINNTLTWERSIAMKQNTHHLKPKSGTSQWLDLYIGIKFFENV